MKGAPSFGGITVDGVGGHRPPTPVPRRLLGAAAGTGSGVSCLVQGVFGLARRWTVEIDGAADDFNRVRVRLRQHGEQGIKCLADGVAPDNRQYFEQPDQERLRRVLVQAEQKRS